MDSILTQIVESGYLFNNCYQADDGQWRVNLRRPDGEGDWFTDWAEAPSLEEALTICTEKMASAEYIEAVQSKHSADATKPDLLSALGLRKMAQPLVRRV